MWVYFYDRDIRVDGFVLYETDVKMKPCKKKKLYMVL